MNAIGNSNKVYVKEENQKKNDTRKPISEAEKAKFKEKMKIFLDVGIQLNKAKEDVKRLDKGE